MTWSDTLDMLYEASVWYVLLLFVWIIVDKIFSEQA